MFQTLQLLLSIAALLIIALTMFFSAADLKLPGLRWHARRVAFVLAGVGAVGILFAEVFRGFRPGMYPVGLHIGMAGVLMTNPFQIPWHRWIWKGNSGGVA